MNKNIAMLWKIRNPFTSPNKKFEAGLVPSVIRIKILKVLELAYSEVETEKVYPVRVSPTDKGNAELSLKDGVYHGVVNVTPTTIVIDLVESGKSTTKSGVTDLKSVDAYVGVDDLKKLVELGYVDIVSFEM